MTGSRPAEILRRLEQAGLGPDALPVPDAELLARFARHRDQGSFATLVRRHGPVVLAVCRRVTAHPQDAEDAFQAVFLVLARKAASVGNPALLGNWLYGVAVRVARRVRRSAARRRAREVQVADMPDPPDPGTRDANPELGPALHEELAGLPALYREPIVLCDLQGVSRTEAAAALGIPEGTLSSRLANGRKKLAARLARRGLVCSAPAVAAVLAESRAAALPEELAAKTCTLVADWSAGAAVPSPVARLAQGGIPVRKMLLLGALTLAITAAGAVLAARPADPPQPADPPKPPEQPVAQADPPAAPAAEPKPDEKATGFTTWPKLRKAVDLPTPRVEQFVWSPDGKGMALRAYEVADGKGANQGVNRVLYLPDLGADRPDYRWIDLPRVGRLVGFTPDGTKLITDQRESGLVSGLHRLAFWFEYPPAAKAGMVRRTVDLEPEETFGYAFAPDGKTFRTVHRALTPAGATSRVEVREVSAETGKTVRTLLTAEAPVAAYALSDNGKVLVILDEASKLTTYDVDTGRKEWSGGAIVEEPRDVAAFGGPGRSSERQPQLALSANGLRTLVLRGRSQPRVQSSQHGGPLPALQGVEYLSARLSRDCFSPDGRLLVLLAERYARREARPVKGGDGVGGAPDVLLNVGPALMVWDTDTGKLLKSWETGSRLTAAFHPTRPVLAVAEPNGEGGVRLGLWDFAAEVVEKK